MERLGYRSAGQVGLLAELHQRELSDDARMFRTASRLPRRRGVMAGWLQDLRTVLRPAPKPSRRPRQSHRGVL